ncbi:MAG: C4-dicarboxylate TRAP transporter substrate-binding protein [Mesorhizobium sp.]|nr:C4-dicarboxylate TRAP transporter substrate-binding protein [Mesorhizobium sp.]MCO5161807.1 C4-dicarboxylate TRAP transporter substrate-binding protein [Mesorhizobium sp.]
MKILSIVRGAALALLLGPSAGAAHADTVRLTVVSGYAPTAAWVKQFQEVFVPEVDKRLAATGNHKIDWNLAWGTIVKPAGEFDAVQNGLADMGIVQTVFHPDKVGVYNISYVTPFVSTDIVAITKAVNGLARDYPAMTDVWAKYRQHMLTTLAGVDNYQIVLRDPAAGPDDLAGRKICGAGLNLRYVEGESVVGVPSPLPDFYNNINSGICDGTIIWPDAIQNFKLVEVAPHMLDVSFGGVNSMALTANQAKWTALPEEVRTVLQETAETYRVALAEYAMKRSADATKAYADAGGKIVAVDEATRKAWAERIPPIASEWAAGLKAQGVPADEILAGYLAAMTSAGAIPLRDWSK